MNIYEQMAQSMYQPVSSGEYFQQLIDEENRMKQKEDSFSQSGIDYAFMSAISGMGEPQPQKKSTMDYLTPLINPAAKMAGNAIQGIFRSSGGSPPVQGFQGPSGPSPGWQGGFGQSGIEEMLGQSFGPNFPYFSGFTPSDISGFGGNARAVFPVDEGMAELPAGNTWGSLPYGQMASTLLNQLGVNNPAINYMVGTGGNLASGLLGGAGMSLGALSAGGFNTMMGGQSDWTNPYSGYASMIPIPLVGQVLGGFLEGALGTGAPPEEVDPSFMARNQMMGMLGGHDMAFGPAQGGVLRPQGEYKAGTPEYANAEAYRSAIANPEANLTPEQQEFYQSVYAPYMAQSWGATPAQGSIWGGPSGAVSAEGWSNPEWNPDPNSPIGQWRNMLAARDQRVLGSRYGTKAAAQLHGTGPGIAMGADIPAVNMTSYRGADPFAGLSDEEREYFYNMVLPEINQYVLSSWGGMEGLPGTLSAGQQASNAWGMGYTPTASAPLTSGFLKYG